MSTINLRTEIEYNYDRLEQGAPNFDFGYGDATANIIFDILHIAASATDAAQSISTIANTKRVLIVDTDNSSELTIKVNGNTVGFQLNNLFVMSDALTALSVTNSNTTTARKILIGYITEV